MPEYHKLQVNEEDADLDSFGPSEIYVLDKLLNMPLGRVEAALKAMSDGQDRDGDTVPFGEIVQAMYVVAASVKHEGFDPLADGYENVRVEIVKRPKAPAKKTASKKAGARRST